MRHGSVDYFAADGTPVPPYAVPLNATGRAQADAAGALFAQAGVAFDRVIASGLARTVETATRVLAA
ncbi:MAG TPA: phosphoglycerate mutase family protein, partial [Burkholderiaceae bacterium]